MPVNFSNGANWELMYTNTYNVQVVTETPFTYYPISRIIIPVQFRSKYLAVYSNSNTKKPNWFSVGYAEQKVITGITAGGNPDSIINGKHYLAFDEIRVLEMEQVTTTYALSIYIHKWIKNVSLTFWQYTGDNPPT